MSAGRIVSQAIAITVVAFLTGIALAQICPDTPEGYARQLRPEGQPANYPPQGEPACFMRGTNEAASYISCYLCHDYMHRRSA